MGFEPTSSGCAASVLPEAPPAHVGGKLLKAPVFSCTPKLLSQAVRLGCRVNPHGSEGSSTITLIKQISGVVARSI